MTSLIDKIRGTQVRAGESEVRKHLQEVGLEDKPVDAIPKVKCGWCGQKVHLVECTWVKLSDCVIPVCCPGCGHRARVYLSSTTPADGLRITPTLVI